MPIANVIEMIADEADVAVAGIDVCTRPVTPGNCKILNCDIGCASSEVEIGVACLHTVRAVAGVARRQVAIENCAPLLLGCNSDRGTSRSGFRDSNRRRKAIGAANSPAGVMAVWSVGAIG